MSDYVLTPTELAHPPSAPITYQNLAALTIKGSGGPDVYDVQGPLRPRPTESPPPASGTC